MMVFALFVAVAGQVTELIIHNEKIYTADDQQPLAEAHPSVSLG
tara:strand:+ start:338 stop:469 length:132 start_codon:yes stop_codon:yes gene_type:complete